MSDAIIVLGRGIEPDGTLSADSASNVRKAVELYVAGRAPVIVMSGKWSYRAPQPPVRTEAAAMKEYAVTLGAYAADVVCEEESLDTLGNVYFTKKLIVEPKDWRMLTIVAAEEHVARANYLFEKIYGPDYHFDYQAAERVLDDERYQQEVAHEEDSLKLSRNWLGGVADGDDTEVWRLMRMHHPAYRT